MKLLIRTTLDKYGDKRHIVFTDESGIGKPLGVFDDIAMGYFVEMYYKEQEEIEVNEVNDES